ncbi:unnamed protein product [Toxocara canis]|uniref:G protein-coupled receptor n=1 Tax=Toxocara canis TaxID=6265 RepID=A0A183UF63_TOXCA|nr:unnamed protein product [Toxocara canis]
MCDTSYSMYFQRYYDMNGDVIMFVTGLVALLPPNGALTVLVLNENMELLSVLVLPFAFVYQYMRICRPASINSLWVHVMTTSAVGVICALVAFNSYLIIVSIMYLSKTDFGYGVIVAHDANGLAIGRMVMFGAPSIVVYVIAGFCAFKSLKKIAEQGVSKQAKKLQRQFTVLISLQAVLPFVFYTLPTCAAYTAVYAGFSPTAIMRLYVALNAWGKCIHPMLCFVFMRPFRIAFIELVPKIARNFRTPIEEIAEGLDSPSTVQMEQKPKGNEENDFHGDSASEESTRFQNRRDFFW